MVYIGMKNISLSSFHFLSVFFPLPPPLSLLLCNNINATIELYILYIIMQIIISHDNRSRKVWLHSRLDLVSTFREYLVQDLSVW